MASFDQYFYDGYGIKQFSIKLEMYIYDVKREDYIPVSQSDLSTKTDSCLYLKPGDVDLGSSISYNRSSQVTRTLSLTIRNDKVDPDTLVAINNWGADYTANNLKWWLDRRIKVYACITDASMTNLPIDIFEDKDVHMVSGAVVKPIGMFCVNGFSSSHGVGSFPTTTITASSNEFLFTSRRGKFDTATTVERGAIISETIKRLLLMGGEKLSRICISPYVSDESALIEMNAPSGGSGVNKWIPNSVVNKYVVKANDDYSSFMVSSSSVKFEISPYNISGIPQIITSGSLLATYNFSPYIDFTAYNAMSFWARCNIDIIDAQFQLWIYDSDATVPIQKVNVGELAGDLHSYKVAYDSSQPSQTQMQQETVENWRKVVIPLNVTNRLKTVKKIELRTGTELSRTPTFWLDDIVVANVKNMNPKELNYNVGQNIWQAIEELASGMQCEAYYTKDGYFMLDRTPLIDPATSITELWNYLERYFGPDTMTQPTAGMFQLTDTNPNQYNQGLFTFEPFYSFNDKRNNLPSSIANLATININELYSFLEPHTFDGTFVIYLNQIASSAVRQEIIDYCYANFNDPKVVWTYNPSTPTLTCNLLDLLNFNYAHLEVISEPGKPIVYCSRAVLGLFTRYLFLNRYYSGVFIIQKDKNYDQRSESVTMYISDLTEDWRDEDDKKGSLYISGNFSFVEGELSNHILVVGGTAQDSVYTKGEMILKEPDYTLDDTGRYVLLRKGGLLAKRKGIFINDVGRIRGINDYKQPEWLTGEYYEQAKVDSAGRVYGPADWVQYYDSDTMTYHVYKCIVSNTATQTNNPFNGRDKDVYWQETEKGLWFNSDTNVSEVYKDSTNIDVIKRIVGPDNFKYLEEQPYSNFTVEKIGDILYALNNGAPTPLITYTWEALNTALYELEAHLKVNETLTFQMNPYFGIDVRDIIQIHDRHLDIFAQRFIIDSVSMPLNGSAFSVTATSNYQPHLNIPYFDEDHKFRYGPYFYGYDVADRTNKWLKPTDPGYYAPFYPPSTNGFNVPNYGENYQLQDMQDRYTYIIEKEIPQREKNIVYYEQLIYENRYYPAKVQDYQKVIDALKQEIIVLQGEANKLKYDIDNWNGPSTINKGNKPSGYVSKPNEGINEKLHYYTLGQMYEFYDLAFFEGEKSLEAGYTYDGIQTGNVTVNYISTKDSSFIIPSVNEQNVKRMKIDAPEIQGYVLASTVQSYQYDADIDNPDATYEFKYDEEKLGSITVRHIGVFGETEYDLEPPLFYPNTSRESVRCHDYPSFNLIGSTTQVTLVIQNNGESIEYDFFYQPKFVWKVTNNFHNYSSIIEPVLTKEDNTGRPMKVLSRDNPLYFLNINAFAFISGDDIYINYGGSLGELTYGLYSNDTPLVTPIITLSIQGNGYSQFFDNSYFNSIPSNPFAPDGHLASPMKTVGIFKFDFAGNVYGEFQPIITR